MTNDDQTSARILRRLADNRPDFTSDELLYISGRLHLARDPQGLTFLMQHLPKLAASQLDFLLTLNPGLAAGRDNEGRSLFSHALSIRDPLLWRSLLSCPATLSSAGPDALFAAIGAGNEPAYFMLKELCCLGRTDENGGNALFHALLAHNETIFKDLLRSGCDPHAHTKNNQNLLHWIASFGKDLNAYANHFNFAPLCDSLDSYGKTPLMIAAESGNNAFAKIILPHCNPEISGHGRKTAFDLALEAGNFEFLDHFAEISDSIDLRKRLDEEIVAPSRARPERRAAAL